LSGTPPWQSEYRKPAYREHHVSSPCQWNASASALREMSPAGARRRVLWWLEINVINPWVTKRYIYMGNYIVLP
jgi:hypothetical protein